MIPKTAADLTAEEMERYREAHRKRKRVINDEMRRKQERARASAVRAASVLRERFHVSRVVLFGSASSPDRFFHERSDIDLAVWGMDEREYYRAISVMQDVDFEFEVDLVMFEDAPKKLIEAILTEGVDL